MSIFVLFLLQAILSALVALSTHASAFFWSSQSSPQHTLQVYPRRILPGPVLLVEADPQYQQVPMQGPPQNAYSSPQYSNNQYSASQYSASQYSAPSQAHQQFNAAPSIEGVQYVPCFCPAASDNKFEQPIPASEFYSRPMYQVLQPHQQQQQQQQQQSSTNPETNKKQ
ncbi:unnamed protein product [Brassicogethes aeneus]|uniref:Uncharacterized protein n=1 Tax=Brassicogethes aeneus TaxID=1431903 RepID=A0A9P0APL5_BRAAE|nr:unnamed protein product [Brassicogethes aeneus]